MPTEKDENKNSAASMTMNDDALMKRADEENALDRLLAAGRLLRRVKDKSRLSAKHIWILKKTDEVERVVKELTHNPGEEWTKQGESHGTYDTIIYYKIDNSKLTARIETPVEQSLLIPLISVFNETELYMTWLPSWEKPVKMGVRKCEKLRQDGKFNQMINVTCDIPWPLASREALIDVVAVDDIDATGTIVVKMDTGGDDDPDAPEKESGAVRIDFDGGILFRSCPDDHASMRKSTHTHDDGDDMVLVCMTFYVDPKLSYVPQSLVNFVTRTVLGHMWNSLLKVARGVRDGQHPEHAKAIERKREIYDWVDHRVSGMLSEIRKEPQKEELGEVLAFL